MSHDSSQEAIVTVEGVICRLEPCPEHQGTGDGEQHYDGAGRAMQNPNGFRHDCAACVATPARLEPLEGVVIHDQH